MNLLEFLPQQSFCECSACVWPIDGISFGSGTMRWSRIIEAQQAQFGRMQTSLILISTRKPGSLPVCKLSMLPADSFDHPGWQRPKQAEGRDDG